MVQHGRTLKMLCLLKEGQIFYDSLYMKCPEQANLWRQKIDEWLLRVGGDCGEMESGCSWIQDFFLKLNILELVYQWLYNSVNIIKTY